MNLPFNPFVLIDKKFNPHHPLANISIPNSTFELGEWMSVAVCDLGAIIVQVGLILTCRYDPQNGKQ